MTRIFISHSAVDNNQSLEIRRHLASCGFAHVFLDFDKDGIQPGEYWEKVLYSKLSLCQAVLIVLTPNWVRSRWCFAEYVQARAMGKQIYPVIVSPVDGHGVASEIQHLDLTINRAEGLARLAEALRETVIEFNPGRSPYPGSESFQEEDEAVFFGRTDDVINLIERIRAYSVLGVAKLLVLVGASGVGKSSLLRAGICPAMRRDALNWIVLPTFRPTAKPIGILVNTLANALGKNEDILLNDFKTTPLDLFWHGISKELREKYNKPEARILISIDQAEELFSLSAADDSNLFLSILDSMLSPVLPFACIVTMRSNFVQRLQKSFKNASKLDEVWVKPLPLEAIDEIIVQPAQVAGISFEPKISAKVMQDLTNTDALPLLAFTLRRLYENCREKRIIQLDDYLALGDERRGLNPIQASVRTAAQNAIEIIRPSREKMLEFRQFFLSELVRITDQGAFAKRPARLKDVPDVIDDIIKSLVAARILIVRKENDDDVVEISHETLLTNWDLTRDWLEEDRAFLIWKQRIQIEFDLYSRAVDEQKLPTLLSGLKLSEAEEWLNRKQAGISNPVKSYIRISADLRDFVNSREKLNRYRYRFLSVITSALIVISLFWLYVGNQSWH